MPTAQHDQAPPQQKNNPKPQNLPIPTNHRSPQEAHKETNQTHRENRHKTDQTGTMNAINKFNQLLQSSA
jgi:hypothetical protein